MALLSISAAARAAGKDRGTIKRYLKDGRLSSTTDATGATRIDTSELARVFGALVSDGGTDAAPAMPQEATADNTVHQLTIETLREQLRAAQGREDWLKSQLEQSQERTRELERRMLPPAEEAPGKKRGFWSRLFSS